MRTSPPNITTLKPNEIFVFGSNYAGRHGRGAALVALRNFGAISGQGTGLMGQSYGIATKGYRMDVLPLKTIEQGIYAFLHCARSNSKLNFLVTEIGCGLAGYRPIEIAPLFGAPRNLPTNVYLPENFWNALRVFE